jgi:hypothetical protein
MNDIDYFKIIKWVLIVLLAGFIGQFGKSLAKHIMSRVKLKREKGPPGTGELNVPVTTGDSAKVFPVSQTERAAAEAQREKEVLKTDQYSGLSKEEAKRKKKELKALAKQQKKEAKLLNKDT